ncbi:hypothetical protein DIPPA_35261 [Diplonema papillatum]|nr:hypothetical protein DIPPA_35261 [Diplonema papillatum]
MSVAKVRHVVGPNTWIDIYRGVVPSTVADFDEVWKAECPSELIKIKVHGKDAHLARFQRTYGGHSYKYSGQATVSEKVTPPIVARVRDATQRIVQQPFDSSLVNFYTSGDQYCGMHSDVTRQLVPGSPIACVSWGATRKFQVRAKPQYKDTCRNLDLDVADGDLVVMGGACQVTHKHAVPKAARCGSRRISFTFRLFAQAGKLAPPVVVPTPAEQTTQTSKPAPPSVLPTTDATAQLSLTNKPSPPMTLPTPAATGQITPANKPAPPSLLPAADATTQPTLPDKPAPPFALPTPAATAQKTPANEPAPSFLAGAATTEPESAPPPTDTPAPAAPRPGKRDAGDGGGQPRKKHCAPSARSRFFSGPKPSASRGEPAPVVIDLTAE